MLSLFRSLCFSQGQIIDQTTKVNPFVYCKLYFHLSYQNDIYSLVGVRSCLHAGTAILFTINKSKVILKRFLQIPLFYLNNPSHFKNSRKQPFQRTYLLPHFIVHTTHLFRRNLSKQTFNTPSNSDVVSTTPLSLKVRRWE